MMCIRIQHTAFLSAAHYQRAMSELIEAEKRSEGYGSIIARLKCALDGCAKALQRAQSMNLTVDLKVLQDAAEETLKRLERDNNVVYLEVHYFYLDW